LTLHDMLGRHLLSRVYDLRPGALRLVIPVDRLAQGVYLLRAEGETFTETRRVVIVR